MKDYYIVLKDTSLQDFVKQINDKEKEGYRILEAGAKQFGNKFVMEMIDTQKGKGIK